MKTAGKKRLLIAGGGYADIPLIMAGKRMNYFVITSGNNENDMGHKFSDRYVKADFSDAEAILRTASDNKVSAICPCSNDFSAISSAYAAGILNLPGHDSYETSMLIHHKDKYREFAIANGIPSPYAKGFSEPAAAINFIRNINLPVLIKPVDLSGGKGIAKITGKIDIENSVNHAFAISKTKRIIIEKFLNGSRHGFSAFIRKGKVVFHFTDNEHYLRNPYLVSGATTSVLIKNEHKNELINQIETISGILSLKDGIFHVQFILFRNKPVIIEICRRSPGDLYTMLVKYATRVDYPHWIVKSFSGGNIGNMRQEYPCRFVTRHCMMADRNGILKSIEYSEEIKKNVFHRFEWWKKGQKVDNYLTNKFGIIFLKYFSASEMAEKSDKLHDLIKVIVE